MARRNENPKSVVQHPMPAAPDSSAQGRIDSGEKVSATMIPEKKGVREPDMNFPAGAGVDRNRGATDPPRRGG